MLVGYRNPYLLVLLACTFSPADLSHFSLLVSLPPPKILSILSRSSHNPFRSWKQLIVYVGIACMTALISTSFPPIEGIFSFHSKSFSPTFSFISAKTWSFDLPITDGRTRYFPCLKSCIGPRISGPHFLFQEAYCGWKSLRTSLCWFFALRLPHRAQGFPQACWSPSFQP